MVRSVQCVPSLSHEMPRADAWLVVDLFRATTTLVSFFEQGGRRCRPVEEVEEALALKKSLGRGWILAGERNAVPPPGFDLGNSPRAFAGSCPADWEGLIMTTTNGTKGLLKAARSGGVVLVASGLNAGAACSRALENGSRTVILCCGRQGQPTLEDSLCAGLLVERIIESKEGILVEGGAREVLDGWLAAGKNLEAAKRSSHARRLQEMGFSDDLDYCCRVDEAAAVPRYDRESGWILPS